MHAALACIALLAVGLWPLPALAQWSLALRTDERTQNCLRSSHVALGLEQQLGRPVLLPNARRAIELWLSRVGDELVLAITLRDEAQGVIGVRELHATSAECGTLHDAAVLAIALMIGDERARAPADSPSKPLPRAIGAALANDRTIQARPNLLALRSGAAWSVGLLPEPTLHAAAALRLSALEELPVELAFVFLGGADAALTGDSQGAAHITSAYAVLAACPLQTRPYAVQVAACLGVQAGAVFVAGHDFTARNGHSTEPLAGLVLRLPAVLRVLGPLRLWAAASVGTPLLYHRIAAVDAAGRRADLWRSSPVFSSIELGLGVELL
jgi:hypothetical protein